MKYEIKYTYGSNDSYYDDDDSITLKGHSVSEVIENFYTYCRVLSRNVKTVNSIVLVED